MTKEEAEAQLQRLTGACVRAIAGGAAPPFIVVAALETHLSKMLGAVVDERDAAIKRAEEAEISARTREAKASASWWLKAKNQRDRAMALLRAWMDAEEGAEPSSETHAFLVEVGE